MVGLCKCDSSYCTEDNSSERILGLRNFLCAIGWDVWQQRWPCAEQHRALGDETYSIRGVLICELLSCQTLKFPLYPLLSLLLPLAVFTASSSFLFLLFLSNSQPDQQMCAGVQLLELVGCPLFPESVFSRTFPIPYMHGPQTFLIPMFYPWVD